MFYYKRIKKLEDRINQLELKLIDNAGVDKSSDKKYLVKGAYSLIKDKKIIYFCDIYEKLFKVIEEREARMGEKVTIVKGFATQLFQEKLTSTYVVGGRNIPMIMCLGVDSGRIYHFAVKALIDLDY